jgi:outer membrane lipoprotein SlyB
MENSVNLRKQGAVARMIHHPVGTVLGGLVTATVCGALGFVEGEVVAAVMAVLGAVVGAVLGAMLAATSQREV